MLSIDWVQYGNEEIMENNLRMIFGPKFNDNKNTY